MGDKEARGRDSGINPTSPENESFSAVQKSVRHVSLNSQIKVLLVSKLTENPKRDIFLGFFKGLH